MVGFEVVESVVRIDFKLIKSQMVSNVLVVTLILTPGKFVEFFRTSSILRQNMCTSCTGKDIFFEGTMVLKWHKNATPLLSTLILQQISSW